MWIRWIRIRIHWFKVGLALGGDLGDKSLTTSSENFQSFTLLCVARVDGYICESCTVYILVFTHAVV